jgi:hypothetical protein
MAQVTEHKDMTILKARIQLFLRSLDGIDLSVLQIWEAAPWCRDEERGRERWDWVTVPVLETVLRDMTKDVNWRVREVVRYPHYRFEMRSEDISTK